MGCEYCEGKKIHSDETYEVEMIGNNIYTTTTVTCVNYGCREEQTATDAFLINYCPMCGRKL